MRVKPERISLSRLLSSHCAKTLAALKLRFITFCLEERDF